MRATLTLDDDVMALLERARRERGQSVQELANDLLRATLKRLGAMAAGPSAETGAGEPAVDGVADRQPPASKPYSIRPFSSGRCFLADLDNVAEVLAWAEGEDFR